MTYAEIVAQRIDVDEQPEVQALRAAFELEYRTPHPLTRYPWHGMVARPGEYIIWDVERAWREYLRLAMEGA
jgi:hypothetical protein